MSLAPFLLRDPPPSSRRSPLPLALTAPALAAALALLAPACSSAGGLDAFLIRAQDAACERLVVCQSVPDVATCKARGLGRLDAGPECLTDELKAGTIVYDPSHEEACLTALRGRRCAPGATIPEVFGACDQVLAGTVPVGGACRTSQQCANGGLCAPSGVCFQRGGVDDPCGEVPEHVCSDTTFCNAGRCEAIAKKGEHCPSGVCAYGLYCAMPSIRCAPTLPLGTPCAPESLNDPCGDGWCDPVTHRCASLPVPGDDCTVDSRCGGAASCIDGVCVDAPDEGQPCLTADVIMCGLGLTCDSGLCVVPVPTTECR